MQYRPILFTCIIILIMNTFLHAQQKDTIVVKNDSIQLKQKSPPAPDAAKKSPAKDTVKVVKHIPRKASIRSECDQNQPLRPKEYDRIAAGLTSTPGAHAELYLGDGRSEP